MTRLYWILNQSDGSSNFSSGGYQACNLVRSIYWPRIRKCIWEQPTPHSPQALLGPSLPIPEAGRFDFIA
jgi:hypothetical protein